MAPSSFPRSGASKEPRAVQFILARLREVQDALTEALIFGTPSVERGVNILWGSYRQERDWWDRLGESKWGSGREGVGRSDADARRRRRCAPLMPSDAVAPPVITQTVIVEQDTTAAGPVSADDDGVVGGEIVEDDRP